MSDVLKIGSDWLADQFKTFCTQQVTYKRGAFQVVLQATVGRTMREKDDGSGIIERWEIRDFLIDAADLILNAIVTLPARGDQIIQVIGATTVNYEVRSDLDEPVWTYADAYRKKLRVHAKQVS